MLYGVHILAGFRLQKQRVGNVFSFWGVIIVSLSVKRWTTMNNRMLLHLLLTQLKCIVVRYALLIDRFPGSRKVYGS